MSHLVYGQTHLNVIKTNKYERRAVFDDSQNYLYTRHVLSVRATFNPATQTDFLDGRVRRVPSGGTVPSPALDVPVLGNEGPLRSTLILPHTVPPNRAGNMSGATAAEAVKHALMQPRLLLVYSVGGQEVLVSPQPGMVCDATNGPVPIAADVVEVQSHQTFVVDFTIQTDINECPKFNETPPVILSNTWSEQQDIDGDFFATNTVTGKAIFDAAILRTPGLTNTVLQSPDFFRNWFAPPIRPGYKREQIQVSVEPNGYVVNYMVVDREMAMPFHDPLNLVTNIKGLHTISNGLAEYDVEDQENINAMRTLTGWIPEFQVLGTGVKPEDIRKWIENLTLASPTTRGKAGVRLRNSFLNALGSADRIVRWANSINAFTHTVDLEISGRKGTPRPYLEQNGAVLHLGCSVTYDITRPFIKATSSYYTQGAGGQAVYQGRRPLHSYNTVKPLWPDLENPNTTGLETPPYLTASQEPTAPPGGRARGSDVGLLVTALLQRPCTPGDNVLRPDYDSSIENYVEAESANKEGTTWPKPAPKGENG